MEPRRPQRALRNRLLCVLCGLCGSILFVAEAQTPPQQAVVETSAGTFVLDLDPAAAPNTTAYFGKLAASGAYDGTTFHRPVKYGMAQGGDPLTNDPARPALSRTVGHRTAKTAA